MERRDWMDWESFVVCRSNVYVGLLLDEVRFDVRFVEIGNPGSERVVTVEDSKSQPRAQEGLSLLLIWDQSWWGHHGTSFGELRSHLNPGSQQR